MIKIKRKNIEQCVKKFPKEIKKKTAFTFLHLNLLGCLLRYVAFLKME